MLAKGRAAWLLRNVVVGLLLGMMLSFLSGVIAQGPFCPSNQPNTITLPCSLMRVDRGFPFTWLVESGLRSSQYGMLANVVWSVDFIGLGLDLVVWSWLSIVGISAVGSERKNIRSVGTRRERLFWFLFGIGSFAGGLLVAGSASGLLPVATPFQGDFGSRWSVALLSYSVAVLGLGTAIFGQRGSRYSRWLGFLLAGFFITLATVHVQALFEMTSAPALPSEYATYGFPVGWMIALTSGPVFVEAWPFVIDVLFSSSLLASLLIVLVELRSRPRILDSSLLRMILASILLGSLLTVMSLVVWRGLACNDTLSCAFPTLGRGFPIPFIREFMLPRIAPYSGGVETQILYSALLFDLFVWTWFTITILLAVGEADRTGMSDVLRRMRTMIPPVALVILGLIVALIVTPVQSDYLSTRLNSLPALGYSIMIFGVAGLLGTYLKTARPRWVTHLSAGVVITLATSIVEKTFPGQGFSYTEYGFPFSWLYIGSSTVYTAQQALANLSMITEWAFIMNVLIWSSVVLAVSSIIQAVRNPSQITSRVV